MKNISLAVLSLYFGLASAQSFPDKQAIPNIIAPVTLNLDTTTIHLSDLYANSIQTDSISFSKGLSYKWNKKEGTVFVTAKADITPLAEMKLWSKGDPYSVLLRTAKKANTANRPLVSTSKLGPTSFTISIKYRNPDFSFAVYWQNFRLGRDYMKPVGDEMLISIPDEASNMERSYIRIFCSDTFNAGNDILIPLQNGRVIRDPSMLKPGDLQGNIARYIPNKKPNERLSMFDGYLHKVSRIVFEWDDRPFDELGAALLYSMDTFGSHYTMGHIISDYPLPCFTSHCSKIVDARSSMNSTYEREALLIAFITAIPGVPLLYSGDTTSIMKSDCGRIVYDSLMSGQKKLNETVDKLFALRASHMALMYGETQVYVKGDIMIIWRNYFSERIVFVFNKSKQAQTIETGTEIGGYVPKFGHMGRGTKVELPPLSFEEFIGRRM